MKLRTKIFSAIAVSAILATSMSAQMQGKGVRGNANACEYNQGYYKKAYKNYNGGYGIVSMVRQLNLSDEQTQSIKEYMKELMSKQESRYSAFSEDKFDKSKYIKQKKAAREDRIELKAQIIEKVYSILTAKQKSQLRVLMDLKEERMKEGCNFDKNCNGRR